MLIDADGEEFKREALSFGSIPDTLDRFCNLFASVADMPVTLLMGQAPAGLNATGDSDIRWFYDHISHKQEEEVIPPAERLVRMLFAAEGGGAEELVDQVPPALAARRGAGGRAAPEGRQGRRDLRGRAASRRRGRHDPVRRRRVQRRQDPARRGGPEKRALAAQEEAEAEAERQAEASPPAKALAKGEEEAGQEGAEEVIPRLRAALFARRMLWAAKHRRRRMPKQRQPNADSARLRPRAARDAGRARELVVQQLLGAASGPARPRRASGARRGPRATRTRSAILEGRLGAFLRRVHERAVPQLGAVDGASGERQQREEAQPAALGRVSGRRSASTSSPSPASRSPPRGLRRGQRAAGQAGAAAVLRRGRHPRRPGLRAGRGQRTCSRTSRTATASARAGRA
jgi:hypothetical protein